MCYLSAFPGQVPVGGRAVLSGLSYLGGNSDSNDYLPFFFLKALPYALSVFGRSGHGKWGGCSRPRNLKAQKEK